MSGLGKRVDPFILLKRVVSWVTRQTRLWFFFFFFFRPVRPIRRIRFIRIDENPLFFLSLLLLNSQELPRPFTLTVSFHRLTALNASPVLQSSLSLPLAGCRSLFQLSTCYRSQLSPSLCARRRSEPFQ
jgi:hypothetical protein